jgi:hypothetical protein
MKELSCEEEKLHSGINFGVRRAFLGVVSIVYLKSQIHKIAKTQWFQNKSGEAESSPSLR